MQGINRRDSRSYYEDLQRNMAAIFGRFRIELVLHDNLRPGNN